MSLTLQPVNASLFIKPDPRAMEAVRVHSLEAINILPKEQLTGKWVKGYSRLLDSSPTLGTTFPPRAGLLAHRLRRMEPPRSCNSEPNLAYTSDSEDEDDLYPVEGDDDDHLFEFDMSPDDEVGEEKDVETPFVPRLRCRTLSAASDSSAGSCSHRKLKLEPEEVKSNVGFKSIFSSTSSGLGSEHRLSQETVEDEEAGGQTFEPSEWRDYMQDRLSSDGSSTPIQGRATPLNEPSPSPVTPILTVSPAVDYPLISPDSLLDGQLIEENRETFQSLPPTYSSCPQCSQSDSGLTPSPDKPEDNNRNVLVLSGSSKTEIGEEDLKSLLGNLDEDRGYPGIQNNELITTSEEDQVLDELEGLELARDAEPKAALTEGSRKDFTEGSRKTPLPSMSRGTSCSSMRSLDTRSEVSEISPLRDFSVDDEEKPRLRKSSSLKTSRSPPRTPGEKKYVRFADIFGLDLSEVKTFTDEIPRIPKAAFQDLDVDMDEYDVGSPRPTTPLFKFKSQSNPQSPVRVSTTSLVPMFTQPAGSHTFLSTVQSAKVCLENAFTESPTTISGVVRVLNIDFHKAVTIRWTVNDWNTHNDQAASYVNGSSDGVTDKFSFKLLVGSLPVGSRVQFCIKYETAGQEFWDSNNSTNYVFQVFLNSNSPGGGGGTTYRRSPVQSIPSSTRFTSSPYQASPSLHGDDPWLRFM